MSFTSADRRYEPFVRPIDHTPERREESLLWEGWALHIEHIGDPAAAVRMLLVHGAGGNAAAMWPYAAHLAAQGARVTTVDLPGYGRTTPVDGAARTGAVTYQDWQRALLCVTDHIADERPLILVGASMGGMLALDTAAVSGHADLVIATCLLDASDPVVRRAIVRFPWMSRWAPAALRLAVGPLRRARLPMRLVAPMTRISNDPGLSRAATADPRGGGGAMPLGWFRSFLAAGPAVAPERYAGAPVILVHPSDDRWTPMDISTRYLARLPVETRTVVLENCGHFPVEEPGFQTLLDTVRAEVDRLAGRAPDHQG